MFVLNWNPNNERYQTEILVLYSKNIHLNNDINRFPIFDTIISKIPISGKRVKKFVIFYILKNA